MVGTQHGDTLIESSLLKKQNTDINNSHQLNSQDFAKAQAKTSHLC